MRLRIHDLALVIVLASIAASCHSAQTSVTGPTAADKCQVNATSTPQSFASGGGTGAISIATARDCTWTIGTTTSWLTLSGDHSGQGEASIAYTVAANPVPTARSGSIVVSSQAVAVSQAAAACTYSLSRASDTVGFSGGALSVSVTTLSGCSWSATSRESWIAIASGQNGNASGTIGLTVAANPGAARVGVINVGGQAYTVNQSAAPPPPPAPAPPPPSPPPSPGPRPGQPIEFDGSVSGLSGHCPNITFGAAGYTVTADGSTDYTKKSDCGDLRQGSRISVKGVTQAGGSVHANRIEVAGENRQ